MLRQIINNLKKLTPTTVEGKILVIIKKNEGEIVKLNKEQLLEGEDSRGEMLKPPYKSDWYAEMKLTLNPLGVVDLKLKGDFHEGFFVNAEKFPFYIFSKDDKTRKLVGQYGIDIFGLNEQNTSGVAKDLVLPEVQNLLFTAIHLR